jgi:putative ABC transport system permease protein
MALQVPIRNPGRSALTTLGLAIGVGAFIAMVSFGRGARSSVVAQFETLGSNLMRVRQRATTAGKATPRPLTVLDYEALRREVTTAERVTPHALGTFDVGHRDSHVRIQVRGMLPDFSRVTDWRMAEGGLFDDADVATRSKVCAIGLTNVKQLFGSDPPLGAVITIDGKLTCSVIGVFAERGTSINGGDLDDRIVMPLTTFETYLGTPNGYWSFEVRPKNRALLPVAKLEIEQLLRRTHQLGPTQELDFSISSPDEVTMVAEQIGGILTGLLAGIAAVSLLVGGIGIMNIQLVSVAERTHEIGIRAAIGASPAQIMQQFLAEAVVLAALGSAAGVALGLTASFLVARQMHWPEAIQYDVVIVSAVFGLAVGILFGYLPARRASNLDPIEALRRE